MSPKTLPVAVTAAVAAATLFNFVAVPSAHAQTKAALVRDVDHAQPVNGYCYAYTTPSFGSLKCTLYSVPAHKRLVVETVSYSGRFHPGKSPSQVVFGLNNPNVSVVYFPASAAPGTPEYSNTYAVTPGFVSENAGFRNFGGSQPLRIHIDENQSLAASAFEDDSSNNDQPQYFAFSGYLIDK